MWLSHRASYLVHHHDGLHQQTQPLPLTAPLGSDSGFGVLQSPAPGFSGLTWFAFRRPVRSVSRWLTAPVSFSSTKGLAHSMLRH